MSRKKSTATLFSESLIEYRKTYNVDALNSPNDIANLHSMIRNQLLITELQDQLDVLVQGESAVDANALKKILDSIVALSETNISLEKTLGIDRKTRKQEATESLPDYIEGLKLRAKEWLDLRLLRVNCKRCNIMVGRISGVYDTTAFEAWFQCPQCKKRITVKRVERDIFYDLKSEEADWRSKYSIEVVAPKKSLHTTALDEMVIDVTPEDVEDVNT